MARITPLGLEGDAHRDLEHHGGPERAVCLFSLEAIRELQAEGHPMAPGALGENVTVEGLDWSAVVPGAILQLGGDVRLEVTRLHDALLQPQAGVRRRRLFAGVGR